MTGPTPILEVEGLAKSFPLRRGIGQILRRSEHERVVALDGVSLSLPRRGTVGIVGESGSGKSTLAKAVVRLIEADRGTVRFEGRDLLTMGAAEAKETRRRVQLIFQDPYSSLNPRLRIGDAIAEPAVVHNLTEGRNPDLVARQLLEQVGLSPRLAGRRPRGLSGGQRQRVAIARALAAKPDVLIADEAVSALDVSVQAQILNLLTDLQEQLDLSIIFISHQLSVISHIANQIAVMYLGRVVEYGPTASVFSSPAHPYTQALLEAQPGEHRRAGRQRPALVGEIPSPLNIPSGCRFRTRCPLARQICADVDPPFANVAPDHASACHVLPFLDRRPEDSEHRSSAGNPRTSVYPT